jgi:hypothetical protein
MCRKKEKDVTKKSLKDSSSGADTDKRVTVEVLSDDEPR